MKWDGWRVIAIIDRGNVRLVSSNGLSLKSKFPGIAEALKSLKVENAILDGELVVIDKEGIPRFELVQRIQQKPPGELIYFTFDLLYLNGEDLTGVPLERRREILSQLVTKEGPIRFSQAIEGRGTDLFRTAREHGLEGIIAKRKGSTYMPGKRSDSWLKIKSRMQQEAVIGGITEGEGSRKFFGALMLGVYDGGRLCYMGNIGTGFSDLMLKDVYG